MDPPSYSSNSKLGPANVFVGFGINFGIIDIVSNIGVINSSDIHNLAFSPYLLGNGLYSLTITSGSVNENTN